MAISARIAAPSNPGAIEGANADGTAKDLTYAQRVELFQTIFTGTVLTFSQKKSIFKNRTTVKTITNGQSARFEAVGNSQGGYMAAGQTLLGGAVNHNKVEVSLDDLFVSHVSIFWPDEDQLHFEAIPIYAEKCAEVVANHYDLSVFQTVVLASKTTTPVVSDYDYMIGTEMEYEADGDWSNLEKVKDKIVDAISVQKAKGYGVNELVMVLGTKLISQLRRDDDFVSVDRGASGDIKNGNANMFMGIELVEDIYWDDRTIAHTGTFGSKYDVDCSDLQFIIFAIDATATVELYGLRPILFDYDKEMSTYLGTYTKVGHGVLNPGGAVSVWATFPAA